MSAAAKEEWKLAKVEDAIAAMQRGEMVIMVDDEDRENEGDLVVAAEHVNSETIAFMAREGRGLICLAMDTEIADRLSLPPMTASNLTPFGTAFTISIDASTGIQDGLSAADRAHTVRTAVAEGSCAQDLVSPGHIFPLRARPGGVLVRSGQTEGSVDLARMAGATPAAVICEIMREDGTMARMPQLQAFAKENDLLITSVADLIKYRLMHETLVEEVARAALPSRYGDFQVRVFSSKADQKDHVVLQLGDIDPDKETLVRVHRANLVWDVFGRFRSEQDGVLEKSLEAIKEEGSGVLLYLEHEDLRWEGMGERASEGSAMPFRAYGIGAQILRSLGLQKIRVLTRTDSPRAFVGLKAFGLDIQSFRALESS